MEKLKLCNRLDHILNQHLVSKQFLPKILRPILIAEPFPLFVCDFYFKFGIFILNSIISLNHQLNYHQPLLPQIFLNFVQILFYNFIDCLLIIAWNNYRNFFTILDIIIC